MSTRTLENCTIIQKNTKAGMREPKRWYNINKCEGYTYTNATCLGCKYCIYSRGDYSDN